MTRPQLLQLGSITDRMRARLSAAFEITELFSQPDQAAFLQERGADFTAVVTDGHWGVPADVMNALPNLRAVSSYGVGYDAIDANAAAARGILVGHTPDVLNDEVAVTTLMLWFAVSRRLVQADAWARSGAWEREGPFPLTHSVMGKTVGIVGLGRIGQTIATRAEAFGARIHYHTRTRKAVDYVYHASPVDLARASDVLVVITPGGAATRHLIDAAVLRALGPEGILINVSRGSVVDETALIAALGNAEIGGAGLDVFEAEPKIPDALKAMQNVVLLPHVGSATVETRSSMGDLVCENLEQFLRDGTMRTPVPECKHIKS